MGVRIIELDAHRDARGSSFAIDVPFASIGDCHVATIRPAAVRGNHFHTHRRELLVVMYTDRWTLAWDDGRRVFEGSGAVLIEIDPLTAHAVRNDGSADLHVFSIGDAREADTLPRKLIEPLTRIAGVDGCRRGWIAVVKNEASIETRLCASDEELAELFSECAVVGIDIPIGLAERGPRSCDHHARRLLGRRASSVFPAPLRPLIVLRDYVEANRLSRQLQSRGISKQGWAIVRKVEQIDRLLQRHRELRDRVYEVHPEVSFAMWNGGAPIEATKRTEAGLDARRALVAAQFGELPPVPKYASENDLLDAFAALWTAERIQAGRSRELGDARVDVTGLPMRIVY
jgi:predicted RNase H-like nuclease